jgi:hypothetical protein
MKRYLIPTFVVALGCAAIYAFTQGSRAEAAPTKEHKVAICHGTASAKNPYVLIIVDESAKEAHLSGHGQNSAPDFALNNGSILTPQQIEYYRKLSDAEGCGAGGGGGDS